MCPVERAIDRGLIPSSEANRWLLLCLRLVSLGAPAMLCHFHIIGFFRDFRRASREQSSYSGSGTNNAVGSARLWFNP